MPPLLAATSTTSATIGTGAQTFTTQSGKSFQAGQFVLIADAGAPSLNWMWGTVTSYAGTSLVVNITVIGGSGTKTNWNISLSGSQGAVGPSGALPISAAGGNADAISATYTPPITLTDQTLCAVVLTGANLTTTPTFSPNGLTAHTITKRGGQPVAPYDLQGVALLEYYAAGTRWELLNPANTFAASNNVTASRSYGTVYHNTLTVSRLVVVTTAITSGAMAVSAFCDATANPGTVVDSTYGDYCGGSLGQGGKLVFSVPPGYYFKVVDQTSGGTSPSVIETWCEIY